MQVTILFTAILAVLLSAITVIDWREMRIPDGLNGLLLLSAITFWQIFDASRLMQQVLAGLLAGALMWTVRMLHARITGRLGLGLGDVKMVVGGAVWLSPFSIPLFIFIASFSGLVFILLRQLSIKGTTLSQRLAFAPCLSIGLMSCWMMENIT